MWHFPALASWCASLGVGRRALRSVSAATCVLVGAVGCREVVAPSVPATMTALSATLQDVVAGQRVGESPTVIVRDSRGAPVAGAAVIFADAAATASPYVTPTASDGTASYPWVPSTHAGVRRLIASAQGVASVEFVANVQPGEGTQITPVSDVEQLVGAGAAAASSPALDVHDYYGNPVSGAKVTFSVDGPAAASVANAVATTDAAGYATAGSWTLGSALGEYTVTATVVGTSISPFVFHARINAPFAVSTIAAGGNASCSVASSGGTYCWGSYLSEQQAPATTPSVIGNLPPVVSLAVGQAFACGLTIAGSAYCWGSNASGQLGFGNVSNYWTEAHAVTGALAFTSIVAGDAFTCGLATDQRVYCWGDNTLGQMGDGSTSQHTAPAPIATTEHFTTIAAGIQHVCAIATTGPTYCWGANNGGQLGAPSTDDCQVVSDDYYGGTVVIDVACARTPIVVKDAPGGFTALAASNGSCGLLSTGQAYCWGYAGSGAIPNTGTFTSIAAANGSVCGITTGHSISCWSYADPSRPPSTLTSVLGVAAPLRLVAGHEHWCAIDGAAVAFCWGDNAAGQLGNGTRLAAAAPLPVAAP